MKKKIIKIGSLIFILIILIFSLIINFYPLQTLDHLNQIEVNSLDEKIAYSLINNSFSSYVKLDEISPCFIQTLINTEDKKFYNHNGFDYKRIIKSTYENIKNRKITQGGSTISQQLSRIAYLNNEKSFNRKFKESIITTIIEKKYSKKQILEMYINNCYFAHNIYGLEGASKYYFGKEPIDLDYSESSLLVGIINAPNLYAPDINYQKSIKKQQEILFQLYKNNIITIDTYYEEISKKIKLNCNEKNVPYNLIYYHQGIKNQIEKNKLNTNKFLKKGLKIDSYLEIEVYKKIEKILKNYQIDNINDQISIVIMKPYTNHVVALYGGNSFLQSSYNRAIFSKRQIGSTIKPFIYYLALKNNLTPLTKFTSEETSFNLENGVIYSPKNASNSYANRKINMVEAISLSDNIYAIKTLLFIGSDSLSNLFNKFNLSINNLNLTSALGSFSLTPLELTSIYNCLASEGIYYSPSFIKKITLSDNSFVYQDSNKGKRILDKKETQQINHLLKSPFDKSFISYTSPSLINYQPNITFSAKTGSTYSSSWVMGYNKYYTIGIYVGNDENNSLRDSKLSKKLFLDISNSLTQGKNENFYEISSSLKPVRFIGFNNYESKEYYV